MLLTEEEAQQKWCPFATTSSISDNHASGIYDTRGESKGFTPCIASDCMAWRWSEGMFWGYCGLAGEPPASI